MTLRTLNQGDPNVKMPSPTKESISPLPATLQLHPPPSPGTHRALRRLQSAHNLGSKAASLISQQRLQQQQLQFQQEHLQRQQQLQSQLQQQSQHHPPQLSQPTQVPSPPRRNANINRSPQRGRANSDAPMMQFGSMTANRRTALSRRSLAADSMSLERLLREGPPSGDVEGALESTRYKILDQGIKTDSDGMVSLTESSPLGRF